MFKPPTKPKRYIHTYVNKSQHFPIVGVIHWHEQKKGKEGAWGTPGPYHPHLKTSLDCYQF